MGCSVVHQARCTADADRRLAAASFPPCPAQSIVRAYGGLRDDTSLVVVDILPPGKTFPECVAAVAAAAKAASGSSGHGGAAGGAATGAMCGCFGSAPAAPAPIAAAAAAEEAAEAAVPAAVGRLEVLADLDVAAVMGLMPETESTTPGWYDEYVGEALFSLAVSRGSEDAGPVSAVVVAACRCSAARCWCAAAAQPSSSGWAAAGAVMRKGGRCLRQVQRTIIFKCLL